MKRGRLWWSLVISILVLAGATVVIGNFHWYDSMEGEQRPDFTLPALRGGEQSVGAWDGKVVILNFWATWCEPCRREIPLLKALQAQYGEKGLQVVGVAIDSRDAILDFAERLGVDYPVLYGVEAAMDVAASYGDKQGTLPYTAVIARDGRIRRLFRKELTRADIESAIRPLL